MSQNMVTIGVGLRIKQVRGKESLNSFAKKLGIHKNTLARYEREESLPDVGIIMKLINLIDDEQVTPNWLLTGEGFPPWPSYFEAHEELRSTFANITSIDEVEKILDVPYISISATKFLDYLKGKYMPTDRELTEICHHLADYPAEAVLSDKRPNKVAIREKITRVNIYDSERLKSIVCAIENTILEKKVQLTPEKKAELTVVMYEETITSILDSHSLYLKISRLLRLIS